MSYSDNPRAPRDDSYVEEGPGHITSDSLAAESLRSGGDFAGDRDRDVQPSGVSSRGTTANVTDDSSATVLPSARDKTERLSDRESYDPTGPAGYEGAYPPRGGGRDNDDSSYSRGGGRDTDDSSYSRGGRDNDDDNDSSSRRGGGGYSNAPERSENQYSSSSGGPQESYGGTAPNALNADLYKAGDDPQKYQPKGRNLQEGGFDDSAPNASFNSMNDEPGSRNDPGRYGLRKAEEENAHSALDSGYEGAGNPRDTSESSGFGRLRRDEDA